jgi:hypothetical protein
VGRDYRMWTLKKELAVRSEAGRAAFRAVHKAGEPLVEMADDGVSVQ